MPDTSWEKVSSWYSKITEGAGHYYHEHVVIPNSLRLLHLTSDSHLLDLGCGSGVLAKSIPPQVSYYGIDAAPSLIHPAQQADRSPNHHYSVADVTKDLHVPLTITHAAFILSLQNIKDQDQAIAKAAKCLTKDGVLLLVLNHPCFRIPRQSSWENDPQNKLQYRRINRYLSPLEIPITIHPGQNNGPLTWSYHHPLSDYFSFLAKAGFAVTNLEEWTSDKQSQGKNSKSENRARAEFPLFLAILAKKV